MLRFVRFRHLLAVHNSKMEIAFFRCRLGGGESYVCIARFRNQLGDYINKQVYIIILKNI